MKKNITCLLLVVIIISIFCLIVSSAQAINVKDYTKDKFPSIFGFYLSSLGELDNYEKEFIDLLEKLPEEEQKYYAKEVYKNVFSLELLEKLKNGKRVEESTLDWGIIEEIFEGNKEKEEKSTSITEEEPIESLPSLIKRIKPSTVIIFAYDDKGEFLKLGSGFFISQNGDVITNYHVIQGASSAEIKTADEKTYPITYIVAGDEQNDLIRLSVNIPSQYVYSLSLSKTIPEVGERIIVYGSPLGLENTVSDGIVSAIRDIPDYGRVIQITAPISPGSSGSPVLNMEGEVIGVATFQSIEGQNLNFAIPSERIANLDLMEEEKTVITEELFVQEEKEKIDSDYAWEAYQKALYFMDKKEYGKALPYLEIITKADFLQIETEAAVFSRIGFCYTELDKYSKAIEAFQQAIRIDPDYPYAYYNLGFTYNVMGNYTKAIEAFQQAIRIDPDYAKAHVSLGFAYGQLGLYKDAIDACKQAIRSDPDYAYAHYILGDTYGQLGLYKDAIEACKQAIRIDPNFAMAHYSLGLAYSKLGLYKDAIEAYKQAIRIDPDYAYAHCNLGDTYARLENYTKAIESFKQAIYINPNYIKAHYSWVWYM